MVQQTLICTEYAYHLCSGRFILFVFSELEFFVILGLLLPVTDKNLIVLSHGALIVFCAIQSNQVSVEQDLPS